MAGNRDYLVWMDLEMTGLEPERCFITEIATLITTSELELVAEGPDLVVFNTEAELATLSDWSRETFTASGLLDAVRASTIDAAEAERQTLAFVAQHCAPRTAPLCGNSIHTDRSFLYSRMRTLHDYLHYRNVDVSSFKEVLRRWYPREFAPPAKAGLHKALADIRESIEELRYYQRAFLRPDPPPTAS
ncbi:MAG: oligoribonuclease [Planctomycetota bacterium]|nr:oligoribonuclease [Planctomycetota bacterium]